MSESIDKSKDTELNLQRISDFTNLKDNFTENIELASCCKKTIARHAAFNPMILCSGCQHIIKCFTGEKYYRQYIKFCKSRGRKIVTGFYSPYYVVIYRSFDSASL